MAASPHDPGKGDDRGGGRGTVPGDAIEPEGRQVRGRGLRYVFGGQFGEKGGGILRLALPGQGDHQVGLGLVAIGARSAGMRSADDVAEPPRRGVETTEGEKAPAEHELVVLHGELVVMVDGVMQRRDRQRLGFGGLAGLKQHGCENHLRTAEREGGAPVGEGVGHGRAGSNGRLGGTAHRRERQGRRQRKQCLTHLLRVTRRASGDELLRGEFGLFEVEQQHRPHESKGARLPGMTRNGGIEHGESAVVAEGLARIGACPRGGDEPGELLGRRLSLIGFRRAVEERDRVRRATHGPRCLTLEKEHLGRWRPGADGGGSEADDGALVLRDESKVGGAHQQCRVGRLASVETPAGDAQFVIRCHRPGGHDRRLVEQEVDHAQTRHRRRDGGHILRVRQGDQQLAADLGDGDKALALESDDRAPRSDVSEIGEWHRLAYRDALHQGKLRLLEVAQAGADELVQGGGTYRFSDELPDARVLDKAAVRDCPENQLAKEERVAARCSVQLGCGAMRHRSAEHSAEDRRVVVDAQGRKVDTGSGVARPHREDRIGQGLAAAEGGDEADGAGADQLRDHRERERVEHGEIVDNHHSAAAIGERLDRASNLIEEADGIQGRDIKVQSPSSEGRCERAERNRGDRLARGDREHEPVVQCELRRRFAGEAALADAGWSAQHHNGGGGRGESLRHPHEKLRAPDHRPRDVQPASCLHVLHLSGLLRKPSVRPRREQFSD